MEFLSAAFGTALNLVVEPVGRQLGYLIFYKSNVDKLEDCFKNLGAARGELQHKIDRAGRNGEEIENNIISWNERVNKIISENEEFDQKDEAHKKAGCSSGLLPYMYSRHRLGRKAKKMALEVDELLKALNELPNVSYQPEPESMRAALSNAGYVHFPSREDTTGKIMAALKDSTVRMIGVCGQGGVGKTTLVKEVAKKVWEDNLFSVVIMVMVTRNPDIRKIQGEISDMLGLRLEDQESEIGRADCLRQRLRKEKTLVILDDLWDKLDLSKLGIQFDNDEDDFIQITGKDTPDSGCKIVEKEKSPEDYKRCKVLLTSRIKEVLSTQMDLKNSSIFYIGVLNDQDSLMLFKKEAGVLDMKHESIESLASEVMKNYCAGLPLAIVTIGRALKDKSDLERNKALKKLEKKKHMGVQNSMEFSVKMSYDHLETEELKSTFLLCAQMGHQSKVMDLVKSCIGLGILQGVNTVKEACEKVDMLIQTLKDSSLLLENDSVDHFIMHDMVRDAALSIAYKEQNVFTVRDKNLDDWPDKDELEKFTIISIHNCDISDELPEGISCPQLKFFHIDNNDPSITIPDNMFVGMKNLTVLILNGFHIPDLPNSIECLVKLRKLCLERCKLSNNLSIIGKLKKLRILSFSGSEFEKLPLELGQLGKLQLLDITDCFKLRVIPQNVISCLTSLEELYMRNSLTDWDVEGKTNESQNNILSELRHLHKLKTLDICIYNAAILPRYLFFDKLNNYKIVLGDLKIPSVGGFKMPTKYEVSRALALQLKEGTDIHTIEGIKMLFKRVENLLLGELNGVRNVFYELNLEGFPDLKHLSIVNNFDIQYIIKSMELLHPQNELLHPQNVFPKLESLCLYKLENMKKICCSQLTNDSLCNLKTIKIQICGRLRNLFSFDMVRLLTKLETIEVSECDSLKEIVVREGQGNTDSNVKDDKIEFSQLRFLTLKSLPAYIGFYTNGKMLSKSQMTEMQVSNIGVDEIVEEDERDLTTSNYLFSEQVEIPNLESLELCSINIHRIWNDQPSSNCCFQKLIKLKVKDCNHLRYLLSFSMAKSLANLKSLFVNGCKMMEEIFIPENVTMKKKEVGLFAKLEEIHLTDMESLKTIWSTQVSSNSFGSLNSVVVRGCGKLVTVFPRHMVGRFKKLVSLKVFNCKSVVQIFDLEGIQQTKDGNETSLQFIYIKELSNLKNLWNKDPEGILNFQNLQTVEVYGCPSLKFLLPVSVAKGFKKLEHLSVLRCTEMEEIIAPEKGSKARNILLEFPQVTFVQFQELPKLKTFYVGKYTLRWPALKRLAVCYCDNLEAFNVESSNLEGKPIFFNEKVLCSLEMLLISSKEAEWLKQCISNFPILSLRELCLASLQSAEILYWLLDRMPNLERLTLSRCPFKEVLPCRSLAAQVKIGTVIQLKSLKLLRLHFLEKIHFEREPVLQMIENLVINECPQLINFAPSSVSFTYLTFLEVTKCNGLKSLVASSTAKSLVQLRTLKVVLCEAMEQIVVVQGNEEKTKEEITFRQLTTIELESLKNLTSFCCSKNCDFKFPSLEKLIVRECPLMKIFSEGVISMPKLQVHIVEEEDGKGYLEGDLNATGQNLSANVAAELPHYVHELKLVDHPELKEIWDSVVPIPVRFRHLKSLFLEGCDFISSAIPSNVIPLLRSLEELEVRNCDFVKVIFDLKDIAAYKKTISNGSLLPLHFPLKKLTLEQLPILENIWKDPQDDFSFQVLERVYIEGCNSLQNLFPQTVAQGLGKLAELDVRYCERLVEIVEQNKEATHGAVKVFVFHCVTSLTLWGLPELKYFFPGIHQLKWPRLKKLDVYCCDKLNVFASEFQSCEVGLVSIAKVAPNLERLSLSERDTMIIRHHRANLYNLKSLELQCFKDESDIPYRVLQKARNIEKLEVSCSFIQKIFFSKSSDQELLPELNSTGKTVHSSSKDQFIGMNRSKEFPVLHQLKGLKLYFLPKLDSIGLEHSWLHQISENLETLEVEKCPHLLHLVPSTVTLRNLTDLTITECHGLTYLFTSSTAKSLGLLKNMSIRKCDLMQGIVTKQIDESDNDEIKFGQLNNLYLDSLLSLRSFYTGSSALNFPSLEQVSVLQCPKMTIFCQGYVSTPKLSGVEFQGQRKGFHWEGDLRTTISKPFEEMNAEFARNVQHLELSDYPKIKDIWHGVVPVPDMCFSNLKSLVVEGCESLSYAIPSNVLPFLNNLEFFEVKNCNSVKAIFDFKDMGDRSITNMGPASNIKDLYVTECHGLEYLFTSTTAKFFVQLENLFMEACESMKEIVAQEEDESTEDEIVFSELKVLSLNSLPSLRSFYTGSLTLSFPSLEHAIVTQCSKMKIFSQGIINTQLLEAVQASSDTEDLWWIDDLNSTIEYLCEEEIAESQCLKLSDHAELKEIWQNLYPIPPQFRCLRSLIIEGCEFISTVISSRFYFFLWRLEELEVRNCNSVKVIFDMEEIAAYYKEINKESALQFPKRFPLKKLTLEQLPSLEHICKDPQDFFSFQVLEKVYIKGCNGLRSVFPETVAQDLGKLAELEVRYCEGLVEIVAGDKASTSGANKVFMFHCLTSLILWGLPKLKYFFPRPHQLKWPGLKKLDVYCCDKLNVFTSEFQSCQVGLVSIEKVALNLERLSLSERDTRVVSRHSGSLHNLKSLELQCFKDESDILYDVLEKVPNIEKLEVSCSFIQKIFSSESSDQEFLPELNSMGSTMHSSWKDQFVGMNCSNEFPFLPRLKGLRLYFLPKLNSIGLEHSWFHPISENLETLEVEKCPHLLYLVPSTVSFPNLMDLTITECHRLIYLFTSSTAKSLGQLKNLSIQKCDLMQEIVAKQIDESDKDEIKFEQLKTLYLDSLPSLRSFYTGISALNFLTLEQVSVFQCPRMTIFSHGDVITSKLLGVEFVGQRKGFHWEGDLKTTISKPFEELDAEFARDVQHLELSDHPKLKDIWHGIVPVPNMCFNNLKSLVVDGCESLSYVIPSNVLPFLKNLEFLEVKNCNCVKAIFDSKDMGDGNITNIGPASNIKDLYVTECHGLEYLFTYSTAKLFVQLENILVEECESVKEIVTKEEDESTEDEIVFSELKVLSLNSLPSLTSFYKGSLTLSFPSLEQAIVTQCPKMKISSQDIINVQLLEAVQASLETEDLQWEGDLNTTMEQMEDNLPSPTEQMDTAVDQSLQFNDQISEFECDVYDIVRLERHPELQKIWSGVVPVPDIIYFRNLKLLFVEGCEFLSTVIPLNLLHFLNNLQELKVGRCDSVKTVFDVNLKGDRTIVPVTFSLRKLTLQQLPNLENIWNRDPQGILSFLVLQEVYVDGCKSLTSLFPSTMAKGLQKLEELVVKNCEELVEIVTKDEVVTDGATENFEFPCMISVRLLELPNLKHFYPGLHKLKWPMLKELDVYRCDHLKKFTSENRIYRLIHKQFSWLTRLSPSHRKAQQ